jgi:hypothetical protein
MKLLNILASFGLCCVLLASLFCLTLFGTLYQVEHGLYAAKDVYFASWFLKGHGAPVLPFPYFPGGMTCMSLLSLNMILGGLVRIKISKRTLGVVVIHIGIGLLLGSGLVKMMFADEGNLRLAEGQQSGFFRSYTEWEVAIWPLEGGRGVEEYVIRDTALSDLTGSGSRTFHAAGLPFELELSNFVPNCRVEPKGPMWESVGPPIDGYGILAMPPEKEAEFNVAGMHARVGDQVGILWALESQPWTVHVGGEHYAVTLRHEMYEMPFEIKLLDFIKEDHPGMTMAKSYRSHVIKVDESGEERVLIQMNEPLRQDHLVLFQSSFGNTGRGDEYSVFSVVRNVADKWPEYSMWVITVGMLLTFARKLVGFVKSQTKRRTAMGSTA